MFVQGECGEDNMKRMVTINNMDIDIFLRSVEAEKAEKWLDIKNNYN